jgi:hypothetical protein
MARSPQMGKVLESLVAACIEANLPAEADKWRKQLAEVSAATQPAATTTSAPRD